jgi:hypothetical protein
VIVTLLRMTASAPPKVPPVPLEGALVDADDRASVWIDGKAGDRSTDSSAIVPADASRHAHGGCGLSPNRAAALPRREALECGLDDFERRVLDIDSGVLVAAQRQPLDPDSEWTQETAVHIRRIVEAPAHSIIPPPVRVRLPPLSTKSEFVSVTVPDKRIVSSPYTLAVQSL